MPSMPEMLATLTIDPLPCFNIWINTARSMKAAASRFNPITSRHLSIGVSASGIIEFGLFSPQLQPTLAECTRISTRPKALIVAATISSALSGCERSFASTMPSPPAARTSASDSSRFAWVRDTPTTCAPSRANSSRQARPMPVPAPVMIATLSCTRPVIVGS